MVQRHMIHIINNQGNINENNNEISPHTCFNGIKSLVIVSIDEIIEKREHLYIVGGNKNSNNLIENSMEIPHQIKNRTISVLVVPIR